MLFSQTKVEYMAEQHYQHEVIVTDKGFPFKLFLFEGYNGKYITIIWRRDSLLL